MRWPCRVDRLTRTQKRVLKSTALPRIHHHHHRRGLSIVHHQSPARRLYRPCAAVPSKAGPAAVVVCCRWPAPIRSDAASPQQQQNQTKGNEARQEGRKPEAERRWEGGGDLGNEAGITYPCWHPAATNQLMDGWTGGGGKHTTYLCMYVCAWDLVGGRETTSSSSPPRSFIHFQRLDSSTYVRTGTGLVVVCFPS